LSSRWRSEIVRRLGGQAPGSIALIGAGNRSLGDDAAGSILAGRLRARGIDRAFDGGTAPENYCERVASLAPGTVFIADAACFGGHPGEVRLLDPRLLGAGGLSTHGVSLRPLAAWLEERCGCRVIVVGIEPSGRGDGEPLSPPVRRAVEGLEEYFAGIFAAGSGGCALVRPGVRRIAKRAASALAAALIIAAECGAQPLDRKAIENKREVMMNWAIRNGVLLKGMTKTEVLKVYGYPDKKFSTMATGGRVEKWTYYFPRRQSVFPFGRSAYASRYRFLYFKDDVLINYEM
jgi:hydrogenase maturation protease